MKTEIKFCDERDLPKVLELLTKVFEKQTRRYFERKLIEPDTKTLAIFVDDRLDSTLTVCDREDYIGKSRMRMCGIGDVATSSEIRGRGFASKLMRKAVNVAQSEGYHISMLFTDINKERFGFKTVKRMFSKVIDKSCPKPTVPVEVIEVSKLLDLTEFDLGDF
ncbi:MAG: hypothetical protein DRQ10_05915 [Candidatus Hydrothermota bacterium]|nr:MAG: hypothetical protein DRQ10_05915 [Candidatus Hydrothermae bacterium]